MPNTRYALVLSGGGFKGAFQVGALEHLMQQAPTDHPLHFDLIAGISAGSINGALLAANRFEELKNYWQELRDHPEIIYTSEFISADGKFNVSIDGLKKLLLDGFTAPKVLPLIFKFIFQRKKLFAELLREVGATLGRNYAMISSIADAQPLIDRLTREVTLQRIRENDTHFISGCCSLLDGEYYGLNNTQFEEDDAFIQAIFASADMPIIWTPVKELSYRNDNETTTIRSLVDGGLRNSSPIGDVLATMEQIDPHAEWKIIIINNNSGKFVNDDKENESPTLGYIARRSLMEITLAEIFTNDVATFETINQLVEVAGNGEVTLPRAGGDRVYRSYPYLLIQPQGEELGELLDARAATIDQRIALGKQRAQEALTSSTFDWFGTAVTV